MPVRSLEGEHVDAAAVVHTERGQVAEPEPEAAQLARPAPRSGPEGEELPRAANSVEIAAIQLAAADSSEPRVPDQVAADHRAAAPARERDRREGGLLSRQPAAQDDEAVVRRPAEVRSPRLVDGQVLDLLVALVADVGDRHRVGGAIERDPAGIAEPGSPDLGAPRDGWIDPQDLAAELSGVLRDLAGIARWRAVPGADVQVAVRPKRDETAVSLGPRLRDREHHLSRGAIGHQRVRGAAAVACHHQPVPVVGIGDVELAGAGVVGREGDRGHAAVGAAAALLDQVRDLEEGPGEESVRGQHPHGPLPLHDVELRAGPGRLGQIDGLLEPGEAIDLDELRAQASGGLTRRDPDDAGRDCDQGSDRGFDPAAVE